MIYPKDKNIDYSLYQKDTQDLEARYGLPTDVKFCKRCAISNQRPSSAVEFKHTKDSKKQTIEFDEEGICGACRVAEQKTKIDWDARKKELKELCDKYRKNDGTYDCLLPGSGGKDSFYASHILKYEYGMHPLTVTWAPHIYTDWGWRNFQKWIHSGFDNILITPNGLVHRLLTRLAMENLLHPFQPFMLGQKNIAPKIALKYDIPLIFYGENEAEYGNPCASFESAKQDFSYFSATDKTQTFLSGTSVSDLKDLFNIDEVDIDLYMPVDPQKIQEKNVEVHYFGYYTKWHPQSCYYYSVEHGGFEASPERTCGTYSKYSSIDDKVDDLHYYTTFLKFGIGRTTYDASQEIRSGDIEREEGVALIKKFDGEYPERFLPELLEYLSIPEKQYGDVSKHFEQAIMDKEYFNHLCDSFRSPHLWKYEDGQWIQRYTIYNDNDQQDAA